MTMLFVLLLFAIVFVSIGVTLWLLHLETHDDTYSEEYDRTHMY